MNYRSEIDGLRAISILSVLLYHAGFSLFKGGFLGVDVFFVISGYLITLHIAESFKNNRFSFLGFYARRAKRLIPAIIFMAMVVTPIAWFVTDPYEFKEFGQSLVSTFTFSSNIFFYLKTGYFDTASELKPLLHTWSLAVEEQFYLVFPLLFWLMFKTGKTLVLILVLLVTSWLYAISSYNTTPDTVFYFLHTRAWELLVGSATALISVKFQLFQTSKNEILQKYLSLSGLVMIIWSFLVISSKQESLPLFTMIPVFGAALVLICKNDSGVSYRFLTIPLMVWIGTVSYSLYLFHQPIFALGRIYYLEELPLPTILIFILLSFFLAAISKYFIEDYFRFQYKKTNDWLIHSLAPVCIAIAVFGLLIHYQNGFPERSALGLKLAQNYGVSSKCSGREVSNNDCWTSSSPETIVWGDSYAMHLASAIDALHSTGIIQATKSSCVPSSPLIPVKSNDNSCEAFNKSVIKFLKAGSHNIKNVYLSSAFGSVNTNELEALSEELLLLHEAGFNVTVVSPTPKHSNTLKCIKLRSRKELDVSECRYLKTDISNLEIIESVAQIFSNQPFNYIDLRALNCGETYCRVKIGEALLFRDNGHLAVESKHVVKDYLNASL
ncbi:MAG: acyltransferase family protein [Aestuariibacter sp.]